MNVLLDTNVLSLAFRRTGPAEIRARVDRLIADNRVLLAGAVRQEFLSGLSTPEQFKRLRNGLAALTHIDTKIEDYELAAAYSNVCRRKGLQGSTTDFLLCAVASRADVALWSEDNDFVGFARHVPVTLYNADVHG